MSARRTTDAADAGRAKGASPSTPTPSALRGTHHSPGLPDYGRTTHSTGLPDGTVISSEEDVRRETLASVAGEEAVRAAMLALVSVAEPADDHDSGSQVPTDIAEGAIDLERRVKGTRRRARRASDAIAATATTAPEAEGAQGTGADDTTRPRRRGSKKTSSGTTDTSSPEATRTTNRASEGNHATTTRNRPATSPTASRTCARATEGLGQPTSAKGSGHHAQAPTSAARMAGQSDGLKHTTARRVTAGTRPRTNQTLSARTARHPDPQRQIRRTRRQKEMRARHMASHQTRYGALPHGTRTGASSVRRAATGAARASSADAIALAAPLLAAGLILITVFLLVLTLLAGGAADEDRATGAEALSQVAASECQRVAASGDYGYKGEAYRDFTQDLGTAWSADFVSWCIHEAGLDVQGLWGRYGDVGSYVAKAETDGSVAEVHRQDGYVPVVGDLAVTGEGTAEVRIAIVTSVYEDGTVICVSGDVAGGEAGTYDRDADGYGGYVAASTMPAGHANVTYLHPAWSAEAAGIA